MPGIDDKKTNGDPSELPKVKVEESLQDIFISGSTNVILGVGLKVISSDIFKKYQETLVENFTVRLGEQIIASSEELANAKESLSIAQKNYNAATAPSAIKSASKNLMECSEKLYIETDNDLNFKQGAFWIVALFGYVTGSVSRKLTGMFLEKTEIHRGLFFKGNDKEKIKQKEDIFCLVAKNVSGVVFGGLAGCLVGHIQSIAQNPGCSPKLAGFFIGCTSALIACVVSELQDYSIKSRLSIQPST